MLKNTVKKLKNCNVMPNVWDVNNNYWNVKKSAWYVIENTLKIETVVQKKEEWTWTI